MNLLADHWAGNEVSQWVSDVAAICTSRSTTLQISHRSHHYWRQHLHASVDCLRLVSKQWHRGLTEDVCLSLRWFFRNTTVMCCCWRCTLLIVWKLHKNNHYVNFHTNKLFSQPVCWFTWVFTWVGQCLHGWTSVYMGGPVLPGWASVYPGGPVHSQWLLTGHKENILRNNMSSYFRGLMADVNVIYINYPHRSAVWIVDPSTHSVIITMGFSVIWVVVLLYHESACLCVQYVIWWWLGLGRLCENPIVR